MERRHELARHGRCILRSVPALNVWQHELKIVSRLCKGQMAGVTDSATIGVGRPIVVVNLLGDRGGSLHTSKRGQQEQYEQCSCKFPSRAVSAHY